MKRDVEAGTKGVVPAVRRVSLHVNPADIFGRHQADIQRQQQRDLRDRHAELRRGIERGVTRIPLRIELPHVRPAANEGRFLEREVAEYLPAPATQSEGRMQWHRDREVDRAEGADGSERAANVPDRREVAGTEVEHGAKAGVVLRDTVVMREAYPQPGLAKVAGAVGRHRRHEPAWRAVGDGIL